MKLAILDLGTNSIRFDVYQILEGGYTQRLARQKIMIRLGDGLYDDQKITDHSKQKLFTALSHFRRILESDPVDVIKGFATSALRDAKNSKEIIDEIFKKFQIKFKVISGTEEATLIAKGILNNDQTPKCLFALIDIGGGSTEVSICHKKNVLDSVSMELGANRLFQYFYSSHPLKLHEGQTREKSLRNFVRKLVEPLLEKRRWPKVPVIIGSSGTIRTCRRILKKQSSRVDPFSMQDLQSLAVQLEPLSTSELLQIQGLEPKRKDLIIPGVLLLHELIVLLGASHIFTSAYSLREGILEHELESILMNKHFT